MMEAIVERVINTMYPDGLQKVVIKEEYPDISGDVKKEVKKEIKNTIKSLIKREVFTTDDKGYLEIDKEDFITAIGGDNNIITLKEKENIYCIQSYSNEPDGILFRGKSFVKARGKVLILRSNFP